jgi:hypothetical protein
VFIQQEGLEQLGGWFISGILIAALTYSAKMAEPAPAPASAT